MTEVSVTAPQEVETVLDLSPILPSDPHERAELRLKRLTTSFSVTLATVADMYRDEDWRYLTREDGSEYASLAEVMADVLPMSRSMARRYVQGARDFFLPLSEMTVDGTVIQITAGDVAELGVDGAGEVVDRARDRLDGVEDPEEAGDIIEETIREAREERRGERMNGSGGYEEDEEDPWEDSPGLPFETNSGDGDSDGPPEPEDDEPPTGTRTPLEDPIVKVLDGAQTYGTEASRESLPADLREIVAAMVLLSKVDASEMAKVVNEESRGVLSHAESAMRTLARLRTSVTTQPWFLRLLDDDSAE